MIGMIGMVMMGMGIGIGKEVIEEGMKAIMRDIRIRSG